MKATVVARVSIAADQATVFEYLSNLKYHYLWNPQVKSFSSFERLKLGAQYSTVSRVLGVTIRAKNTVTKFEKPNELELENKVGLVKYLANFSLHFKAQKTQVILSTTVISEGNAFAFSVPVLKKLAQRELQTDMQALKIAVENKLK